MMGVAGGVGARCERRCTNVNTKNGTHLVTRVSGLTVSRVLGYLQFARLIGALTCIGSPGGLPTILMTSYLLP